MKVIANKLAGFFWVSPMSVMVLPLLISILLSACTPKVEVAVPDKPITINLNVKIEHEIRVKVEKDLEDLFSEEDAIF